MSVLESNSGKELRMRTKLVRVGTCFGIVASVCTIAAAVVVGCGGDDTLIVPGDSGTDTTTPQGHLRLSVWLRMWRMPG